MSTLHLVGYRVLSCLYNISYLFTAYNGSEIEKHLQKFESPGRVAANNTCDITQGWFLCSHHAVTYIHLEIINQSWGLNLA